MQSEAGARAVGALTRMFFAAFATFATTAGCSWADGDDAVWTLRASAAVPRSFAAADDAAERGRLFLNVVLRVELADLQQWVLAIWRLV